LAGFRGDEFFLSHCNNISTRAVPAMGYGFRFIPRQETVLGLDGSNISHILFLMGISGNGEQFEIESFAITISSPG
jgi:hypothetical protein